MKGALSTKNLKMPLKNQTPGMSGSLEDPCVLPRRWIESNYSFKFKYCHQELVLTSKNKSMIPKKTNSVEVLGGPEHDELTSVYSMNNRLALTLCLP